MLNPTQALFAPLLLLLALTGPRADEPPKPADAPSLDGSWEARYVTAPGEPYVMDFADGTFHAMQGDQWYKGDVVVDAEAAPARIDFTIRECDCGFLGKTSTGILRWDGDTVEIRAPEPGKPRPAEFDEESGETMRLVRRPG